jgi:hypothetical protein
MRNELKDAGLWNQHYEAISGLERYEFLVETFSEGLEKDFYDEADIVSALLLIKFELLESCNIERYINLVNILEKCNPEVFNEGYDYLIDEFINYHVFIGNLEKVQKYMGLFIENSLKGIDQTMESFRSIIYYGHDKLAVEIATKCWKGISDSDEILEESKKEFAEVISFNMIRQLCCELKSSGNIEDEKVIPYFGGSNLKLNSQWLKIIRNSLNGESDDLLVDFCTEAKRKESLQRIMGAFIDKLVNEKDVGFTLSAIMGDKILYYFEKRKMNKYKISNTEDYFSIEAQDLDKFLQEVFEGLLSYDYMMETAFLWIIPYFYDFLYSKKIISKYLYNKVIKGLKESKKNYIRRNSSTLWKYDFVHRWNKPDHMSDTDFQQESLLFKNTLHKKIRI